MIYLNFTDLDDKAQQRLLAISEKDVEAKFGEDMRNYAKTHYTDYDALLEQACPEHCRREALRNLYTNDYVFNI